LGRQDRATCVESRKPRLPQSAPSVEFTEGFLFCTAPMNEAVSAMNNETRSPSSGSRNLRSRGPTVPAAPPPHALPTPHRTVGAHEENASECNSGRGVARPLWFDGQKLFDLSIDLPSREQKKSQRLQGPYLARRALARGLLRRLRRPAPRLPAAEGSLQGVLPPGPPRADG